MEIVSHCSKYAFSAELKKHVSLQRKQSMLETAESSKLFPCEKCDRFWKKYFLQLRYIKVEIGALFSE
jgi:hypothetical protein